MGPQTPMIGGDPFGVVGFLQITVILKRPENMEFCGKRMRN